MSRILGFDRVIVSVQHCSMALTPKPSWWLAKQTASVTQSAACSSLLMIPADRFKASLVVVWPRWIVAVRRRRGQVAEQETGGTQALDDA